MLKFLEQQLAEDETFEIDVRTTDRRVFKGLKVLGVNSDGLAAAADPALAITLFNAAEIVSITIRYD